MALNASALGALIDTNLAAILPKGDGTDAALRKDVSDAIAKAVVAHIQKDATVNPATFVAVSGAPGAPVVFTFQTIPLSGFGQIL